MTTMKVDLNELERLAKAASPGPWECHESWQGQSFVERNAITDAEQKLVGYVREGDAQGSLPVAHTFEMDQPGRDRANAQFIAACNPAVVLEMLRRWHLVNDLWVKNATALGEIAASWKREAQEQAQSAFVFAFQQARPSASFDEATDAWKAYLESQRPFDFDTDNGA